MNVSSASLPVPGETRPREARVPRDHERVALDHLEQRAQCRLVRVRMAGEAAARRAADGRLVAVGRRGGRPAPGATPARRRGSARPSTQARRVSRSKRTYGKPGLAYCAAVKSAKRAGSTAAGPSSRAVATTRRVRIRERRGVALDAPRRSRPRARRRRTSRSRRRCARRASRRASRRARSRTTSSRGARPAGRRAPPGRRGRRRRTGTRGMRADHAATSCAPLHGAAAARRAAGEHAGHRGTRWT